MYWYAICTAAWLVRHAGHVLPFARCEGRYPHRVLAFKIAWGDSSPLWCWGPVSYGPAFHTRQLPSRNLQVWFYQFYPVERNAYLPLKSGIFIGRVHLHRYVRTSSLRALGPGRRRRSRWEWRRLDAQFPHPKHQRLSCRLLSVPSRSAWRLQGVFFLWGIEAKSKSKGWAEDLKNVLKCT